MESRLRLEADAPAVSAFADETGGELVRRDDDPAGVYWLILRGRGVTFTARVAWRVYPDAAPSVQFASAVGGGTADVHDWPLAEGFRPPGDICKPFTAEGQALHTEWAASWRRDGNPFLWVAETLHGDIARGGWRRAA